MRRFSLPEVLAARDDLLARIAALLEIHAAEHFEVDHLRNELLLRRRKDGRNRRGDFAPPPRAARLQRQRERGQPVCSPARRSAGSAPRRRARMAAGSTRTPFDADDSHGDAGTSSPAARSAAAAPGPIRREGPLRRARVDELRLRAQHEHRQALHHRSQDLARQLQHDRVTVAPLLEGREQATLRRAVAVELRTTRRRGARHRWSAVTAGRSPRRLPRRGCGRVRRAGQHRRPRSTASSSSGEPRKTRRVSCGCVQGFQHRIQVGRIRRLS